VESLLHALAHPVALAIESIAIVIIAFGSARALAGIVRIALSPSRQRELSSRVVTLEYGHWLIAGLTFQLAADVVNTSFSPTWSEVGRLAAVAAIRTFLSYFLDLEMERARRQMQEAAPLRT
jgi:uncharacterized membrane protein